MRVVFNSFNGRYSDTPRAIQEALVERDAAHEPVWFAEPTHAQSFPDGVRTVPIYTEAALEALESADLVVSNSHLEMGWSKSHSTTYVQTWHGTPLKRIHADALGGPPGLLERLSEDVDRWDALLSPNPYSTAVMRRAFRWSGEVLETGYPRNDVLLSPQGGTVRGRVRKKLGIAEGRTVVLYTPTWRDDAFWDETADKRALALDVDRFTAGLGDGHVLLLRLHYKLSGLLEDIAHSTVMDVSHYPEIADLYLAADVMVTDYSSTMFDFAVTGKPLFFYTYDFDRYRDEVRGFYFDLSVDPPGPLVTTTHELVERLVNKEEVARKHKAAYARFQERFCPLDDGMATERFIQRFFG